jgi:hypothetical protein
MNDPYLFVAQTYAWFECSKCTEILDHTELEEQLAEENWPNIFAELAKTLGWSVSRNEEPIVLCPKCALQKLKHLKHLIDEVYGNLSIEKPEITREFVEEQLKLREETK